MNTLQLLLHPGLIQDKSKNWRQRRHSPHLRCGSLDSASGPLSILMALSILGITKKGRVKCIWYETEEHFNQAWKVGLETYFSGADHNDVVKVLHSLDDRLLWAAAQGTTSETLAFTQQRLKMNELVVLGLNLEVGRGAYWVLAIGTEQVSTSASDRTTALVCLDPNQSPPTVAPFNGHLSLESPRRGSRYLHYAAPAGLYNVSVRSAIALSRRR